MHNSLNYTQIIMLPLECKNSLNCHLELQLYLIYFEHFHVVDMMLFTAVSLVPFHRCHFHVQFCKSRFNISI